MGRALGVGAGSLMLLLGACATYQTAEPGRLNGRILTMWVGENYFVYVPAPKAGRFVFETARSGRHIAPGLMYTDGGSIPRFAQAFKGFSPWGFGPAYVVHDWIFYGRHCDVDRDKNYEFRFNVEKGITFDESAAILAEMIRTLVDYGQVPEREFAADIISGAVDSAFARALWDQQGACKPVSAWHIAVAWKAVLGPNSRPPKEWKLTDEEINSAKKLLPLVPDRLSPESRTLADPTITNRTF